LRQAEEREQQRQQMRDRELKKELERERHREKQRDSSAEGRHSSGVGLVIGNQLTNPDPVCINYSQIKDSNKFYVIIPHSFIFKTFMCKMI